jgi:hypothetical protein
MLNIGGSFARKGVWDFFRKKVQEINFEKSIGGTQNPCTFLGERKALATQDHQIQFRN